MAGKFLKKGTVTFNGAHFKSLVQMAVDDAQSGRDRLFDGPEQGNVALLSVRMLGWEEITEQGPEPARAMARKVAEGLFAVLRAEDVLGRTREDTFTLLLRGCPMTVLGSIARRCVEVVENCAVSSDGEELTVRATSCVVSRTDEGVEDLLAATFRALN